MKKIIYSLLLMMVLISTFAVAKDVEVSAEAAAQAGVTPDSFLWGLETAMENMEVAFTFNEESKARKRISFAKERFVEARIMAERNNFEGAEKARIMHQRHMIALKNKLQLMQNTNTTEELKSNIEFEQELNNQENEADSYIKLKIMVKGDLNEEQKSRLIALFESFKNESNAAKLSVQQEREKIKIKLRTKESLTVDEVSSIEDEVIIEGNASNAQKEVVASQFVRISGEAVAMAEQKVNMIEDASAKAEAQARLDSAKALHAEASIALEEGRYEEARLIALQARKEARNALIMSVGHAQASNTIRAEVKNGATSSSASSSASAAGDNVTIETSIEVS